MFNNNIIIIIIIIIIILRTESTRQYLAQKGWEWAMEKASRWGFS